MIKLTIELREDGKIYITGPLHLKDVCLGMLEEAKEVIKNYKKTAIAIPSIKDLKKLNGNNV